jgi:predicted nuclease with TOPRIM domain
MADKLWSKTKAQLIEKLRAIAGQRDALMEELEDQRARFKSVHDRLLSMERAANDARRDVAYVKRLELKVDQLERRLLKRAGRVEALQSIAVDLVKELSDGYRRYRT